MATTFTPANKPKTKSVSQATAVKLQQTPGPLPLVKEEKTEQERVSNSAQYTYQYGIKNIELNHSLYKDAGVFVTRPIDVEGNIMEVSLSTVEEHPLFNELDGMATDRVTSIEYYISLEENPSLNDWVPILPEEVKKVKSERLFFNGKSAKLLFHADISDVGHTKVYKNNISIKKADWYFTERGAAVQLVVPHDKNAVYTMDYVPNSDLSNPWNIEVGSRASKRIRQIDEFPNGTDSNNTVKLSKYPYVDYARINSISEYEPNTNDYRPLDVFLKDGNIVTADGGIKKEFFPVAYSQSGEFHTKNRTDYKHSKDATLNRYSIQTDKLNQSFEYKQEKNKLVFTESFNRSDLHYNEATNHGNASLVIHYDYLVTNFRLKVILRKNTGDELVVTPAVNSYQLKFKVMK